MKALIVGGGIAGLATAVALRKIGIDSVVFEQAPEIREVGAALSLWSNAIRMLGWLELEPTGAQPYDEGATLDAGGRVLRRDNLGPMHERLGVRSLCMRRPDLLELLATRTPRVELGARFQSLVQDQEGVTARFENGHEERGDFLVGADGIHSKVREALLGRPDLRFAGYTVFRALAERPCPVRLLYAGVGAQVGVFPCAPGQTYWFATWNLPRPGARLPHPRELFRDWGWRDLLEATPDSAILQNDVWDIPPARVWGRGRVTLLGDSIHPTTPNLGQGACQALESAVALAMELARGGPLEESLRRFEAHRRPRTASITNTSWRFGRVMQVGNPWLARMRNFLMSQGWFARSSERALEKILAEGP